MEQNKLKETGEKVRKSLNIMYCSGLTALQVGWEWMKFANLKIVHFVIQKRKDITLIKNYI